jgi:demethylmenaquinone methyltransferase/2-methoxy-6-polyprenyl-1,4-benzoquinol methylase
MALGDVGRFHRFARPYDLLMPPARRSLLAAALSEADRDVSVLLDVGGGSGRASRAVDAERRVVVDAARGMLRQARGHGLEAVQADAGRLPVASGSVDAVLIVDALHHIRDPDRIFRETARVLRPGGVLVVREFDPTTVRGRALVVAERVVGFDSAFWSPDELAERVTAAGLRSTVLDRGFGYTVVGVAQSRAKAGEPNAPRT